jgi:hypothetical protein
LPIQTRPFLFSFIVTLGAACSPAPEPLGPTPGRSDRPHGGPSVPAASTPDAGATIWERWPEFAAYRVAIPRAPSQHLTADHEGETLANASAAAYPNLGPASPMPAGAVLVQRLYASGAQSPEVVFAMVKKEPPDAATPAAWEYLVLEPSGVVTERGMLESCARCHAEAPYEGLFGRAR